MSDPALPFLNLPKFETLQAHARRFPMLDASAIRASLALRRVGQALGAAYDAHFARHELSAGRFTVLLMLAKAPDHTLSAGELAECSSVTRASMTGLLDTLEAAGQVQREPSADDRRRILVRLTPAALAQLEAMLPDHFRRTAALMAGLSEAERETLVALLGKVASAISAVRDP
jgi:DNA-binding MarR family transcriptional regulator